MVAPLQQVRRLGTSPDWSGARLWDGAFPSRTRGFYRCTSAGLWLPWLPFSQLGSTVPYRHLRSKGGAEEEDSSNCGISRDIPLSSGDGHLVVATTEPGTMLGDTAVAVHPDDEHVIAT